MAQTLISIMCYICYFPLMDKDPRLKDSVPGTGRPNAMALLLMPMSHSPGLLPIVPSSAAFRILTILFLWASL